MSCFWPTFAGDASAPPNVFDMSCCCCGGGWTEGGGAPLDLTRCGERPTRFSGGAVLGRFLAEYETGTSWSAPP